MSRDSAQQVLHIQAVQYLRTNNISRKTPRDHPHLSQGYVRSVSGGFAVWLRPPVAQQRHRQQLDVHKHNDSACSAPLGSVGPNHRAARPLVFLHGVGLGLVCRRSWYFLLLCSGRTVWQPLSRK